MFGKNKVRKYEDSDGSILQVREVFYTLQGEGPFTGQPAVFVRLTGCNLRCAFCDTAWNDENDPYRVVDDIVEDVERLAYDEEHERQKTRLVVLTGGEPLRQNIRSLLGKLIHSGYRVQIETAGTLWQDVLGSYTRSLLTVVVSPKTGTVHEKIAQRADAYKYVVSADDEYAIGDGLPVTSTQHRDRVLTLSRPPALLPRTSIYLSPMDEYDDAKNAANRAAVARFALEYGYTAGVQLHKLFSLE